jgi:nucleoside-diphosphate-sugar epimerase
VAGYNFIHSCIVFVVYSAWLLAACMAYKISDVVCLSLPDKILGAVTLFRWMGDDILKDVTAQIVGTWPNTYTFTKAIAEDFLLRERDNMPVAIFRPSIVTCSTKEPMSVSIHFLRIF